MREALDVHGCAVLSAPPGTGKTTWIPLALAGLVDTAGITGAAGTTGTVPARRVLVAEPRRLAARAAARRMAWILGEKAGDRVGYTVRGERRVSDRTLVEVVTTGVLLQRLQRDPDPGADTVVLDECHERHLDADTALAFLLDVRGALLPELRLVAASATADTGQWSALLGGAPVVAATGTGHPVETVWCPPERPLPPPHGTRVHPDRLAHVAAVLRRALAERPDGDVLCFLPGVGEIARVAGQLAGVRAEVLQLHGRAPQSVQDAVLAPADPGGGRRVILSTSVAESSLTVPGVRVVVDSGLAREPRTDHARGLSALATVRVSRAAAEQRAGRAGREAPGAAYRCWSEADHDRLAARPSAEITLADLTSFALQAACWGDPDAGGLALLDRPPAGAMTAARELLADLGAVDGAGRATPRGRALTTVGAHPRLARALLDAAPELGLRAAAESVALLSEEPPSSFPPDLSALLRTLRHSPDSLAPYTHRWRTEARRLEAAAAAAVATPLAERHSRGSGARDSDASGSAARARPAEGAPQQSDPRSPGAGKGRGRSGNTAEGDMGLVVALAYPERIARRRDTPAQNDYLMASGTAATADSSGLSAAPWLAIAAADRPLGRASARIRSAAPVDEETARVAAAHLLRADTDEVTWRDGDVVARRVTALGAIELSARPLSRPSPEALRSALLQGLGEEGVDAVLHWPEPAVSLRRRLAFLHHALGAPWPDVSSAALAAAAPDWLEPELSAARRRADLERIRTADALTRLLPWATGEATRLDELAPERIQVPSGSRIRVDYSDPERPVLAAKLQELFGWSAAPALAGGRVPLTVHLLSPAGRPAAVTGDLASFWQQGYRAVRADLRGRYPRHPWPEDPSTAVPTRRTNPRR
ncbi:ATP-dependent RNA helicase [Phaeacidiphilus oryzae]|uniref:ATP-dependent RNA helicase n=1 Tax=Phaeacidiphilus oryzae TaxID=348818 RepID=UPI000689693A|nr:ATP-dependent helicase C-terminal domain-containing protein [Phaeacidiphilus oryzae]